jgi:hypothetical protein
MFGASLRGVCADCVSRSNIPNDARACTKNFGIDFDIIKLASAQASFRLPRGVSIVAPFCGRLSGVKIHYWYDLGRRAFTVQSSQDRFDCGHPVDVENALLQSPVPQDFPRELDEILRPEPFNVRLQLNVAENHLAYNLMSRRFSPGAEGRAPEKVSVHQER